MSPIGLEQAQETGKSLLFLLEANPGPGLGVLLAYMFFGKGTAKESAPGAGIIHFFGGIHEIYFPYVLMRPFLVLAVIFGGMAGVLTLVLLGGGLSAPASPGSIIAILAVTPPQFGVYVANLAAVIIAAAISFVISSFIIKAGKDVDENIEEAAQKMQEMKGKKSSVVGTLTAADKGTLPVNVNKIVFACDAGMGSSAMGASLLRKKVKEAGLDINVTNTSISNLPTDAEIVITQEELTPRAKEQLPGAYHISVENFLSSPEYDMLIDRLQSGMSEGLTKIVHDTEADLTGADHENDDDDLLKEENIFLNQSFSTKEEAIRFAGEALVRAGYVKEEYVEAMIEREKIVSTYMGNYVAIPHGTDEAKKAVLRSGFTVVQVPDGVDFDGNKVKMIFGIAGKDGTHLNILSNLATICSEVENVEKWFKRKQRRNYWLLSIAINNE